MMNLGTAVTINPQTAADIDNAMVEQKDTIHSIINMASEWEELKKAERLLDFVSVMWSYLGYGYKTREIRNRIADTAIVMLAREEAYLSLCRKNDRTRHSTEKGIKELNDLIMRNKNY